MLGTLRPILLGATALAAATVGAPAQNAAPPAPPPSPAQNAAPAPPPPLAEAPAFDPTQLPAVTGRVARYTLTPRGDVDGLILADGTEVHFPPHLSTQLVYAVRPGDTVTVHGLKALSTPMVAALSITNDASHQTVMDTGRPPRGGPRDRDAGRTMDVQGRVQAVLHGPRGEVNGALLDNGTVLRMPPPEAARVADLLQAGQTVAARGPGLSNALGTVIEVRAIGASPAQLVDIAPPRGPRGPKHGPREAGPPPPPPRG